LASCIFHNNHQRKGYGAILAAKAIETKQDNNLQSIILTVKKLNHTAIFSYQEYNLKIIGDSIIDIDDSLFMYDYLMSMTEF